MPDYGEEEMNDGLISVAVQQRERGCYKIPAILDENSGYASLSGGVLLTGKHDIITDLPLVLLNKKRNVAIVSH